MASSPSRWIGLAAALCAGAVACGGSTSNDHGSGGNATGGSPATGGDSSGGRDPDLYGGVGGKAVEDPPLPERPEWTPPFATSGEVGWRSSTEELCSEREGGVAAHAVWANDDGVYVVIGIDNRTLQIETSGRTGGVALYRNDGVRWEMLYELTAAAAPTYMVGAADGAVYFGTSDCGVLQFRDGAATCVKTDEVKDVAVDSVSGDVFALTYEGIEVLGAGEAKWRSVASDAGLTKIAAQNGRVVAVGPAQTVLLGDSSGVARVAGVPAGDYGAVLMDGANSFWTANAAGQVLRYDAGAWTTLSSKLPDCQDGGVEGFWGDGDTLYYHSVHGFGRVEGGVSEALETWSCDENDIRVASISGNATRGEVYLSVVNTEHRAYECGATYLFWYNGTKLQRF